MTEREKMLSGRLYDCGDPELLERWHLAKDLIKQYNALPSGDLKTICDYGNNIFLGNHCEINLNCVFLDDNRIEIGDYALIGPSVQIYTAFHPADFRERFALPRKEGEFAFCRTQRRRNGNPARRDHRRQRDCRRRQCRDPFDSFRYGCLRKSVPPCPFDSGKTAAKFMTAHSGRIGSVPQDSPRGWRERSKAAAAPGVR